MDQVSQDGRRSPRPWTAQDQTLAEVAAACGVGVREIGRAMDRSCGLVRSHLIASVAANQALYSRRWQLENRETASEWRRQYYRSNRAALLQQQRQYWERTKERQCARRRQYYQENQERERAVMRSWYDANRERVTELVRQRKARIRAGRRAALRPLTADQRRRRFAMWRDRCAYCDADGRLTVDHVLALSVGGLDEADNVAPACGSCNCSKNNSPVGEWYRRQPFFTEARWRKIQRHCPTAMGQATLPLPA
jgi:5-methylcytosine-specific restriction endonuclease McrA